MAGHSCLIHGTPDSIGFCRLILWPFLLQHSKIKMWPKIKAQPLPRLSQKRPAETRQFYNFDRCVESIQALVASKTFG